MRRLSDRKKLCNVASYRGASGSVLAMLLAAPAIAAAAPQVQPGLVATATQQGDNYRLQNAALTADWTFRQQRLTALKVTDAATGSVRDLGPGFALTMANGERITATSLPWKQPPQILPLAPSASTRVSDSFAGKQICVAAPVTAQLNAQWCLVLRDGSPYLRQTLRLQALGAPAGIREVTLLDLSDAGAHVAGTVKGSPVVDDHAFMAFEHPLAQSAVQDGHVTASLHRTLPLQPGAGVTYSSVIGFAPAGQMRRTFLAYLERERIHPYRPFLTYNSWYDLGTGDRYNEAGALDRIHAFGEELVRKRGITLNSFLFDDGWDNPSSFWQFNAGFPHGMTAEKSAAASYGAGVGFWLSPWGGYNEAKLERVRFGTTHGYEIVKGGYALSGPRYFRAFEHIGDELIADYGANQFKIDGTGNADQVVPGSAFDSDFSAAISLLDEWRQRKPTLFLNVTTGTYPSPFWLMYADSIWRGGEDHSFAGVGSWRQKWITYRDGQTYKNIVRGGPLFPLNSLMLHSIIYGRGAEHLGALHNVTSSDNTDFADEVWTFFGCGTDLQELYVTPSLLNAGNWDQIATAAKWSRAHSATLQDTHWVGGDPNALQPYGWASWTSKQAILVLRNPSDHTQSLTLNATKVFELPAGTRPSLQLHEARSGVTSSPLNFNSTGDATVTLAPFEVRVLQSGQ